MAAALGMGAAPVAVTSACPGKAGLMSACPARADACNVAGWGWSWSCCCCSSICCGSGSCCCGCIATCNGCCGGCGCRGADCWRELIDDLLRAVRMSACSMAAVLPTAAMAAAAAVTSLDAFTAASAAGAPLGRKSLKYAAALATSTPSHARSATSGAKVAMPSHNHCGGCATMPTFPLIISQTPPFCISFWKPACCSSIWLLSCRRDSVSSERQATPNV
mmetsp:Transcript_16499/g.49403  ORF Transcript_16499/g.49403 Transcript_16499/m.49403 type:complete len:220 (-) Transcript_16499:657-1316(-)